MKIDVADLQNFEELSEMDCHIPKDALAHCIRGQSVFLMRRGRKIVGFLRYSLFWQTIPFLDLILLKEDERRKGYGTELMEKWETEMKAKGYRYVMTSTQADEDAWRFYENRGYRRAGGFFPPEQEAEEWIYIKML